MLRAGAVIAAILTTAFGGCGVVDNRASYGEGKMHAQTLPEWIACSRTIAIGDVVKVVGADSPRVTVTMHITQWTRPDHGSSTLVFSDKNPKIDGNWPAWEVSGPVLVVIPTNRSDSVNSFRGKQLTSTKQRIDDALDEASTTSCPPRWATQID